jgi:hypothetical protein
VLRSVSLLAFAGAIIVSVTACGSSGGASPSGGKPTLDQLPTIQFVGNATCPTSGASPYFTTSNGTVKPAPVNSLPAVGQAVDEMPHTHVTPPAQITYNHTPPTSGCHYNLGYGDAPVQAGVYDQAVDPQYWVHNLEHGYIVVLYNCPSGCSNEFQQLRSWYHSLSPSRGVPYARALVLPYTNMNVPFAAVSWDWYDPMPVFSLDEVKKFYANHENNPAERNAP